MCAHVRAGARVRHGVRVRVRVMVCMCACVCASVRECVCACMHACVRARVCALVWVWCANAPDLKVSEAIGQNQPQQDP